VQKPTISEIESTYHGASELICIIFFIVNVFHHTSRKTSRRDLEAPETLKRHISGPSAHSMDSQESRELQGLGQHLGSCNVLSRILNVSSQSRLGQNFERLGLGDMGLRSRLGSEGLVHIPGSLPHIFYLPHSPSPQQFLLAAPYLLHSSYTTE